MWGLLGTFLKITYVFMVILVEIMYRCFYLHKFSLKLRLLQIICIWSILFIFISHHMISMDGKNYHMLKNITPAKQIVTLPEDLTNTGKHFLYLRFLVIFSVLISFSAYFTNKINVSATEIC